MKIELSKKYLWHTVFCLPSKELEYNVFHYTNQLATTSRLSALDLQVNCMIRKGSKNQIHEIV